jgi:hypothetical protein
MFGTLEQAVMIHDILVHIPTERLVRPVVDASVSLAAEFKAHLDAVAIGYVWASRAYVMDGGAAAVVASVFEMERERAAQRAAAALEVFGVEARTAGISYQSHSRGELPGDAAAAIGATARLYDLAVVLQPDADQGTLDNTIPREVLFQAGGGPGLVRASSFSRSLQGQAHRYLLGRKPAGCPRAERCPPFFGKGGYAGRSLH